MRNEIREKSNGLSEGGGYPQIAEEHLRLEAIDSQKTEACNRQLIDLQFLAFKQEIILLLIKSSIITGLIFFYL